MMSSCLLLLLCATSILIAQTTQPEFDLLLKNGHVIDPKNKIDAVRDVAIKDGKIVAVQASVSSSRALETVDAAGLYVTPGLVDIHVHVYVGLKKGSYAAGDRAIFPDAFTFRTGVTSVADAGSSGWRNFSDFKDRIVDRSKTRVFSFLNIVGAGMDGVAEQNLADMEAKPAIDTALKYKGLIVGIKSAHFAGREWTPYERAEEVARAAGIPVMVDFGENVRAGRSLDDLFMKYFRPGDIYTHMYGGFRGEQDSATGSPSNAMIEGRQKGVIFDVGHGGASFAWSCAVPMIKAGFLPDSISTDLHDTGVNGGLKDMLNLMGKFLAIGLPLQDVILRSTWNPAKEIHHEELGNLSLGSPADVAVLRVEKGHFGFTDMSNMRLDGTQRLVAELTVLNGKVVYDLNGITHVRWDKSPKRPRD